MASLSDLASKVRFELGDQPITFSKSFAGDGNTVMFDLGYKPIDTLTLTVTKNGVPQATPTNYSVNAVTGALTMVTAPVINDVIQVTGNYYRYFTDSDIYGFINTAVTQHTYNRTDAYGSMVTIGSLPPVEDYPLTILASIEALWVLATDSSYDIDIQAPDGVMIPRSERFRQLTQIINARMEQYKQLCSALNIGLWRIEMGVLRRVSRTTNKLVPIYMAQEIDDSRRPERVFMQNDLTGRAVQPAYGQVYDLVIYQGDNFAVEFDFPYDVTGYTFKAQIRTYPNAPTLYATFTVTVLSTSSTLSRVRISLDNTGTAYLPVRGFWDLQVTSTTDPTYENTPIHGQVFVVQQVTLD